MALPPPSSSSTVVVTGASSGIGADLARDLSRRGYGVTLVARRAERLQALADELPNQADVEPCDLTDTAARTRLLATLADRDVVGLCNNAGYGSHGPFHTNDLEWEQGMVELNVMAMHHLTGGVLPRMVEQGTGAVLNLASLASYQPVPNMATYAATKAFVASFSEAIHAELAGTGVSVTAVSPGPVHTEFGETAGVDHVEQQLPEFVYVDSAEVARHSIDAMIMGRRTVVPTLKWKVTGIGGRLVPRGLFLPIANRVGG